jgi:hypothetical protein
LCSKVLLHNGFELTESGRDLSRRPLPDLDAAAVT